MRQHHRQVISWLETKGATNIQIRPGGKHLKLCFNYQGRDYAQPISSSPSDNYRGTHKKIKDLRHTLGLVNTQDDIVISTPPRTLQEITTMLNTNTTPFNTPRVLPVTTKPTATCIGAIACYRGNGGVFNFRISEEVWKTFRNTHPENSYVGVEWLGDNSWKIFHDKDSHSRFRPYNKQKTTYMMEQTSDESFQKLGHFYTTPAEFVVTDGVILATLKEEPRREAIAPQVAAANTRRKQQSETQTLTAIANTTTTNQTMQLAALLEAIRRVESTTEYRLMKLKENDQTSWVFKLTTPTIIR